MRAILRLYKEREMEYRTVEQRKQGPVSRLSGFCSVPRPRFLDDYSVLLTVTV